MQWQIPSRFLLCSVEKDVVDNALPYLVRVPMSALETKTKGVAWRNVPVTYILMQQNYSVPRVYRDLMLEKMKKRGCAVEDEGF